jgi:Uncharacterized MobA-related protein
MAFEGVILAAGLSTRAGAYKMTLNFNGKTIIENVVDDMTDFCSRIIVVGGYRYQDLEPVLKKYKNLRLVYNEKYMEGMFSSIKKGLSLVRGESFFLTPGDYPLIGREVYKTLSRVEGEIVIPTFNERKGHPVLIKSYLIKDILSGTFVSLRDYIRLKSPILVPVNQRGILIDIDTMEDLDTALDISDNPQTE